MEWKNGGEGGRWKVERWGEWVGEIIVEAEELNKIKKRGARGEGRGAGDQNNGKSGTTRV